MNKFNEMLVFVRAAERRGFSAAARELDLTPSAVSKQITRLEDRLSARLFQRSTRRLILTQEGRAFYEPIKISGLFSIKRKRLILWTS